MSNITISAGVRSNLLALQNTASLLTSTQERLATGKKVNSALDNPLSFFTAKGLNDRADGLNGLLDGMSNGIQTVKAANKGLESITKALDTLKGIANQAKTDAGQVSNTSTSTLVVNTSTRLDNSTGGLNITNNATLTFTDSVTNSITTVTVDSTGTKNVQDLINQINTAGGGALTARVANGNLQVSSNTGNAFTVGGTAASAVFGAAPAASVSSGAVDQNKLNSYAKQFNETLQSITQIAADSGFNGSNLLTASTSLKINFNEDGTSNTTLTGKDVSLSGLGLGALSESASTLLNFTTALTTVTAAFGTVKQATGDLSNKLSIIQNRQDFSKGIADVLKSGADSLVNADTNAEAANVLALQTRQQLSQTALSLSNQADQAVLRLF